MGADLGEPTKSTPRVEELELRHAPVASLLAWADVREEPLRPDLASAAAAAAVTLFAEEPSFGATLLHAMITDAALVAAYREAGVLADLGASAWTVVALAQDGEGLPLAVEWLADPAARGADPLRDVLFRSREVLAARTASEGSVKFAGALRRVLEASTPEHAAELRIAHDIQEEVYRRHFRDTVASLRSPIPYVLDDTLRQLEELDIAQAIDASDAQRGANAARKLVARMRERVEEHFEELRRAILEAAALAPSTTSESGGLIDLGEVLGLIRSANWASLHVGEGMATALRRITRARDPVAAERVPLRQALLHHLATEDLPRLAPHAYIAVARHEGAGLSIAGFARAARQDASLDERDPIRLARDGYIAVARLAGGSEIAEEAAAVWRQEVDEEARRLRALLASPAKDFLEPTDFERAAAAQLRADADVQAGWPVHAATTLASIFRELDVLSQRRRSDLDLNRQLAMDEIESAAADLRTRGNTGASGLVAAALLDAARPRPDEFHCDLGLVELACVTARQLASGTMSPFPEEILGHWGAVALLSPDLETVPERRVVSGRAWEAVRMAGGLDVSPVVTTAIAVPPSDPMLLARSQFDALESLLTGVGTFDDVVQVRFRISANADRLAQWFPDAIGIENAVRVCAGRAQVVQALAGLRAPSTRGQVAELRAALQPLFRSRGSLGVRSEYVIEGARALIDLRTAVGASVGETLADLTREFEESFGWLEGAARPDRDRVAAVYTLARLVAVKTERDCVEALQLARSHATAIGRLIERDQELAAALVRLRERAEAGARPTHIRVSSVQYQQLETVGGPLLVAQLRRTEGKTLRALAAIEADAVVAGTGDRARRRDLRFEQAATLATRSWHGDLAADLPPAALARLASAALDDALVSVFSSAPDEKRIDAMLRAALNLSHRAQMSLATPLAGRLLCRTLLAEVSPSPEAIDAEADLASREAGAAGVALTTSETDRVREVGLAAAKAVHGIRLAATGEVAAAQSLLASGAGEVEKLGPYPELTARIDDIELRARAPAPFAPSREVSGDWREIGRWQNVETIVPERPDSVASEGSRTWLEDLVASKPDLVALCAAARDLPRRTKLVPSAGLPDLLAEIESATSDEEIDLRARAIIDTLDMLAPDGDDPRAAQSFRRLVRSAVGRRVGRIDLKWESLSRRMDVTELGRATIALRLGNVGAPVEELDLVAESSDPETEVVGIDPPTLPLARKHETFVLVRVISTRFPGAETALVVRWRASGITGEVARGEQTMDLTTARYADIPTRYVTGTLEPSQHAKLYFGRGLEEHAFVEPLVQPRQTSVPFVFGMNRVGKSSVLRFGSKRLPPTVFPLEMSLNSLTPQADAFSFYARLAQLAWESAGSRAAEFQVQSDTARGFRVQSLPGIAGEVSVGVLDSTIGGWDGFRTTLDEIVRCTRRVLLLLLDDFDRVGDVLAQPIDPALLDPLAELATRPEFRVALASGQPIDAVRGMFAEPGTKLLRNSQPIHVSFLRRDELDRVVQAPVSDDGIIYSEAALDAIWRWTGGFAFQAQHICSDIQVSLNAEARRVVQPEDVEDHVTKRLALSSATLVDPFRSAQILVGIAADLVWEYLHATGGERPWSREAFRAAAPARGETEIDAALSNLVHREILQEVGPATARRRAFEMRNRILANWLLAHPTVLGRQPERPTDPLRRAGERLHSAYNDARGQLDVRLAARGAPTRPIFRYERADADGLALLRRVADLDSATLADVLRVLYMSLWEACSGGRGYLREQHPHLFVQLQRVAGLRNHLQHRNDPQRAADVEEARRNELTYQDLVRRVSEPPNSRGFARQAKILFLNELAEAFESSAEAMRM